jgi:integrase
MGKRIVEKSIKKMAAPEEGNRITWDSEIPGFGVRVTAAGVTSFILDYRISGRQRRYTIGRHSDLTVAAARIEAGELRARIRDGHDPMEERHQGRKEPTLGDLATEYLERHAVPNKRPSSLRVDRQMIDNNIRPGIGKLRLKAVGRRDIEALHLSLKATPYAANRLLSLLSKMFNLGIQWKWTAENPARGVPRFQEGKRERWLTTKEIQRFREALDSYTDQNAANALRLLMLTGSREGEVLKAEWEQFDFQRNVWTKPSHNTKQKRVEHIPLSPPTLKLLKAMMPKDATGPLFPGKRTDKNGGTRVSLRRPWIQACKASGLVVAEQVKGKRGIITRYRPTVRIHDLRHSYASHLVSNGVSLQIVGKLLGHTQASTTMRYAHLQDETLRAATNQFGDIYTATKKRKSGT